MRCLAEMMAPVLLCVGPCRRDNPCALRSPSARNHRVASALPCVHGENWSAQAGAETRAAAGACAFPLREMVEDVPARERAPGEAVPVGESTGTAAAVAVARSVACVPGVTKLGAGALRSCLGVNAEAGGVLRTTLQPL